ADLAAGVPPGAGNAYGAYIGVDLEEAMLEANASAYVRAPFSLADPSAIDLLTLRIRYDDGFVAYVNGTEVARRNAPPVVAWNSAATQERAARDAVQPEAISISQHAGLLRAGANVLAIQGLNSSAGDPDFLIEAELVGSSASGYEARYFTTPTPGGVNRGGVVDFVADTKFSVDRGFYEDPFEVEITTLTPGAVIRYTVDGTAPSETHGEAYSGPLLITTTTTLRAAAFKSGYLPTNIDTQTYIFLDDVIRQPNSIPGYPSSWAGYPADYAMDPEICTNTASPHYQPAIKDDLKSIPTLSLVLAPDDLMGPTRGIYTHPLDRGLAWERAASIEMIHPDAPEDDFQVNCGVRMHGNSSARPVEAKHSFRLLFKRDYGPPKLREDIFDESTAAGEYNTIVLRCFSTDSWHFKDGGSRYRRWDSQFIRDQWMRDTQLALGHIAAHGTHVHLYVNGLYWGLYNPSERPDDDFQVAYQGDRAEDWDIIKDFNELFRGERASFDQLMSTASAGLSTTAAYQRIQGNNPDGTRNPAYPVLIEVDPLIDYMMLHFFAGAEDWPHHNWFAARSRTGNLGGWKWIVWDQEIVLDFAYRDRLSVSNDNSPALVYARMRANPDFRMRFADRVQMHMFHGGALTVEESERRWMKRAREIDRAVVGESARWGDFREDHPDPTNSPAELYTREGHWIVEQEKVIGEYIPESHRLAIQRFRSGDLYPQIDPPSFSQQGGIIEDGFALGMTAAEGTIYYTADGTDPRLPGGEVSPAARIAGQASAVTILASGAPARALVPADGSLGLAWIQPGFDDAGWIAGTTGVGYERTTGFEELIGTDLLSAMDGANASAYIRVRFDVSDPAEIDVLTLRMKYDDGFIAYLNGTEIARVNAPAGAEWDSAATGSHEDGSAVVFEDYDATAHAGLLQATGNVLAIHGLNSSPTSSDFLILPELVSSQTDATGLVLDGPTLVKARVFSGEWSALNEAFFYRDIPLRITELMYNPRPPGPGSLYSAQDFEFVELQNISDDELDLHGIRITGGIDYEFSRSPVTRLAPREVLVVARDVLAFASRHDVRGMNLVGGYSGRLSNGGEPILLEGPAGEPILDFEYEDSWHPETDGEGYSLIAVDPGAAPEAWDAAAGWRASDLVDGSPGLVEGSEPPVGGWQIPGDINQDALLDISDAIRALLFLFAGQPLAPPCEGPLESGGNMAVIDVNDDGLFNLSDPVFLLGYLFQGGRQPPLGARCQRIA
ncbi:MAG: chitobiase/beta-hexosaminidase C-terminal domain-containing protein, partial [Planctomycetes bacterium]|nr:chitobiase/beta-hexosaminidase C-terminal domain-containing protein [Planctomycetota bacterium]